MHDRGAKLDRTSRYNTELQVRAIGTVYALKEPTGAVTARFLFATKSLEEIRCLLLMC